MNPQEAEGGLDRAIAVVREALAHDDRAAGWHDLGALYLRRGALAESRAAFERAVELDPSLSSAHNNLGNTYAMLGELERAVESYRRAIAGDPALSAAHANAAVALFQLGNNDEALVHARAAAELDPRSAATQISAALIEGAACGYETALARIEALLERERENPSALAARAYALLRLERFNEVVEMAERNSGRPDDAALLEALGCALRALGRFDEAFAAFDRAAAVSPDPAEILVLKAGGLLEIGAFEVAGAALERALALAPHNANAWLTLSELRAFAAGDPVLGQMERVLATAPALRAHEPRTMMHFALGRAYHKAGETATAFAHFAAGNVLKRSTIAYDIAADEAFAAEQIAYFTPATMQHHGGGGDASRAPIFVLGMPRSGTSLVEQILAAHPEVFGAGELTLFDRAIEEVPHDDITALGSRYLALVDEIAPAGRRVVDKLPANFRHAALIHLALPRAKIVHCMRDPLDTCFSAYTTLFTGRQDFSFDLVETGRYYRAYAQLMDHWRSVLPPGVMLDLRYEELVADVEAGARRLLAFCDLPWNDAVLRYYELARPVRTASYRQVRQPIYTTSIGTAERYRSHLQPLIDALGETL